MWACVYEIQVSNKNGEDKVKNNSRKMLLSRAKMKVELKSSGNTADIWHDGLVRSTVKSIAYVMRSLPSSAGPKMFPSGRYNLDLGAF